MSGPLEPQDVAHPGSMELPASRLPTARGPAVRCYHCAPLEENQ